MRNAQENLKRYRLKNRDAINERKRSARKKNRASWEGHIPSQANCQICGKIIYFGRPEQMTTIHFDHTFAECLINGPPSEWLRAHKMTDENVKIWDSCKFGFLCKKCNSYLPTRGRADFAKRLMAYVELGGVALR